MKSKCFATAILAALTVGTAFAEIQPSGTEAQTQPGNAPIESTSASGEKQTTIIDEGGNLKIIDKPAPMPPSSAEIPLQNNTGAIDSTEMIKSAPSMPQQSVPQNTQPPGEMTSPPTQNTQPVAASQGTQSAVSLPMTAQPAVPAQETETPDAAAVAAKPAETPPSPAKSAQDTETGAIPAKAAPYGPPIKPTQPQTIEQPQQGMPQAPSNVPMQPVPPDQNTNTGVPMPTNTQPSMQITPSNAQPTQGMEETSSSNQLAMASDTFETFDDQEQTS